VREVWQSRFNKTGLYCLTNFRLPLFKKLHPAKMPDEDSQERVTGIEPV
jgi:hypothetical protein